MSRLGYLARNPKRTLGTLGTLLVASGLVVGSGAFFTDTDSSLENSATAATFGITMLGSSDPAFDAYSCDDAGADKCNNTGVAAESSANNTTFQISRLVPGSDTYTRRFALRNDGNVPAAVRLMAFDDDAGNGLLGALETTVERVGTPNVPVSLTGGDISTLNSTFTIPAGTTYTYELTFSLPDTGDQNSLIGDAAELELKAVANDENEGTPAVFTATP